MSRLSHSNKGNVNTYLAVVTFLFTMGILTVIGYYMTEQIFDAWDTTGYIPAESAQLRGNFLGAINMMDYAMVLVMVALLIGVALTSYRLATAPVFFIVTFFMASILGFISYFFNYAFSQFITQSVFDSVRGTFPLTILICTNAHWISLAALIIGSITLYAKREQGQQGEYVEQ